jgi:hypothetical protein
LFRATADAAFSDDLRVWAFSYARAYVAGKPLMRDAGSLARGRDDVGRLRPENAVENFIRWDSERDEQPDRRPFIADCAGGNVELCHDVVDRLVSQLRQIPLGQVVRAVGSGVHELKVAPHTRDGIGCFPISTDKSLVQTNRDAFRHMHGQLIDLPPLQW